MSHYRCQHQVEILPYILEDYADEPKAKIPETINHRLDEDKELDGDSIEDSRWPDSDVSLIFASADNIRNCPDCKTALSKRFKIPDIWWADFVRRSNGYFSYQDLLDSHGNRTGVISWTRFIVKRFLPGGDYHWTKLNAFSFFQASPPRTDVLLFYPRPKRNSFLFEEQIRKPITASIFSDINPRELNDPFWIYPRMIQQIVNIQDKAVWECRDLVRDVEKTRSSLTPITKTLQETPRHLIHVHETLCAAETTLESIKKHHDHFLSTVVVVTEGGEIVPNPPPNLVSLNIRSRLSFQHHMFTSLRLRSSSSTARIATEVTIIFNEGAYKDAKVLRMDSTAMRTVAFVTVLFLPATFVSAIFGTGFISYDAPTGMWGVSPKFWIFWAVAVPITLMTILGWFMWMRYFLRESDDLEKGRSRLGFKEDKKQA